MNSITVGELRALLANMPADAVLRAHTDGDETARLELVPAGNEYGRWLEHLEPGDTWEAIAARNAERDRLANEWAEWFRRLIDGDRGGAE